jgi:hypothetical protein
MSKSKLLKVIDYIIDYKTSRLLLAMKNNGYLVETGWLLSFKKKQPVDSDNNPIPWVTYSFLKFIDNYLTKEHDLFEFGSGNSTRYYAQKVKSIYTIEHDLKWFNKIKENLPDNVIIRHKNLDETYEESVDETGRNFDIIIVDGRRRNNCIIRSIHKLNYGGIIVLDDSERESYKTGIKFLEENGFKRLDFWGISPGYFQNKCTSIFFKDLLFIS